MVERGNAALTCTISSVSMACRLVNSFSRSAAKAWRGHRWGGNVTSRRRGNVTGKRRGRAQRPQLAQLHGACRRRHPPAPRTLMSTSPLVAPIVTRARACTQGREGAGGCAPAEPQGQPPGSGRACCHAAAAHPSAPGPLRFLRRPLQPAAHHRVVVSVAGGQQQRLDGAPRHRAAAACQGREGARADRAACQAAGMPGCHGTTLAPHVPGACLHGARRKPHPPTQACRHPHPHTHLMRPTIPKSMNATRPSGSTSRLPACTSARAAGAVEQGQQRVCTSAQAPLHARCRALHAPPPPPAEPPHPARPGSAPRPPPQRAHPRGRSRSPPRSQTRC